ncbi:MAG: putative membrane protein YphA (DoxX/SURF4 family) [Pirellulaceae bacterium]|jgi:uncharacterized membrane protein YphA (DoxX/SURF4 family)
MNQKTGYWITTLLFCVLFTFGGFANLLQIEAQKQIVTQLGYPLYFMTLLGMAKLIGVVILIMPGFPRLKEWAYAGFTFVMLGAAFSHLEVADPAYKIFIPLVIMCLGITSCALRPANRKLVADPSGRIMDD